MISYRAGKDKINVDELGSLYIDKNMQKNYRPLIYIPDQLESVSQVFRNITGKTFDPGHALFDGSFMYEYSTRETKSDKNAINFADTLIKCLEAAGLNKVDIITKGYGGLVAACASKSDLIGDIVTIHPSILGTPLASYDIIKDNINELKKRQKWLARLITIVVNNYYGFQKDNSLGINNPDILRNIDLSKLLVVGSSIDRENEKSKLARDLYDIIYAITGEQSDGVVIYNEETLRKYRIRYFTEIVPKSHFTAGREPNLMRVASKFFEGYEFDETDIREIDTNNCIPEKDNFLLKGKKKKVIGIISKDSTKDSTKEEIMLLENKKPNDQKIQTLFDKGNMFLRQFQAETKDRFLDLIYFLDGKEDSFDKNDEGYETFIDDDFLDEEDGLKFLSLDDKPGQSDILDLCKKAEEERILRLRNFGGGE